MRSSHTAFAAHQATAGRNAATSTNQRTEQTAIVVTQGPGNDPQFAGDGSGEQATATDDRRDAG